MMSRRELAPGYDISRVIKGGWHLAGGHGEIDRQTALRDMARFVDAGVTTFDCADIYTGVEALIGDFRRAYPDHARRLQVHTKYVPDLADLATLDARGIEATIDRSLRRLGMERLDLVQFHWWDYAVPRYVETAQTLARLQGAGKIARIGLTNVDMLRLRELLAAGIPVVSHQVQYSLLDHRPDNGMVALCRAHGIQLLCYGTVAGGFLSERWLGRPAPAADLQNRSLVKYQLIIDDFGGWSLFQELLTVLHAVACRHGTDIASVASRCVLDRPQVAAVIVGATSAAHLASNAAMDALQLDAGDHAAIDAVTRRRLGPSGDVYDLERDRTGRHGKIMKYALNRVDPAAGSSGTTPAVTPQVPTEHR